MQLTDGELTQAIVRRVVQRAGRRVWELAVSRHNGSVVVRGRADSYYAWQLTVAACQEVLADARTLALDCRLDVAHVHESNQRGPEQ